MLTGRRSREAVVVVLDRLIVARQTRLEPRRHAGRHDEDVTCQPEKSAVLGRLGTGREASAAPASPASPRSLDTQPVTSRQAGRILVHPWSRNSSRNEKGT